MLTSTFYLIGVILWTNATVFPLSVVHFCGFLCNRRITGVLVLKELIKTNVNQYYLHSCILLLEYRLKLRFFIINHDTKVEVKLLLPEESKQCFWSISFMAKIKSHLWIICILMKKTFHQNKVFNKYNHKEDGVNMFQVANITVQNKTFRLTGSYFCPSWPSGSGYWACPHWVGGVWMPHSHCL